MKVVLATALDTISPKVNKLYSEGDYTCALATLSELKEPVDNFFEHVMVNADQSERLKRESFTFISFIT